MWRALQLSIKEAELQSKWKAIVDDISPLLKYINTTTTTTTTINNSNSYSCNNNIESIIMLNTILTNITNNIYNNNTSDYINICNIDKELITQLQSNAWSEDNNCYESVSGYEYFGYDNLTRHIKYSTVLEAILGLKTYRYAITSYILL